MFERPIIYQKGAGFQSSVVSEFVEAIQVATAERASLPKHIFKTYNRVVVLNDDPDLNETPPELTLVSKP